MNSKKLIIIASIIIGIGIIGFALSQTNKNASTSLSFSTQQLEEANGKNGKPCYVALESTVYEIKQGNKWKDGEHTTSEGQAYCGMDATEVIKKSPHGKTIMSLLTKVGSLQK